MAGVRNVPTNGGSGREISDWLEHLLDPYFGNMITGKQGKISSTNNGMGSGETCGINFKTPVGTVAYIDFSLEISTTGRVLYTFYEGASYTPGGSYGSNKTPYWSNRNQSGTPTLTIGVLATPDSKGTELIYVAQGGAGRFGGAGASTKMDKIRLLPNTYYFAEISCKEDDTDIAFVATWDEVDG